MPGRKYSAGLYRYGFNGKENDNELKGEGNQQDYGLRIYDNRLARFLSVDPLTESFPELTPYQFASNRPIDGIDLDGAEYTPAQLVEILGEAKAALGVMISENATVLRGISNAVVNANTIGITDNLGSIGTDNVNDYSTAYNKSLYLWGRVVGDVAAAMQGAVEVTGGTASVGGGLAISTTGVGAVAGLPTAIVGGIVVAHGAGVGTAAALDLGETLNQLKQLGAFNNQNKTNKQKTTTTQQASTNQTTSAQNKKTEATASATTAAGRSGKLLGKKDGVEIKSYGTNDAHKPAHAHVKGEGPEVRIGPNGKPLKNQPELTSKQFKVIEFFKKEIRKELNKVGKANQLIEQQAKKSN